MEKNISICLKKETTRICVDFYGLVQEPVANCYERLSEKKYF